MWVRACALAQGRDIARDSMELDLEGTEEVGPSVQSGKVETKEGTASGTRSLLPLEGQVRNRIHVSWVLPQSLYL